ncbi:hypothetical protein [Glycomyces harbinensis]|uniref:Immunity protein Imm1 n=1 Tax=Glycomyces harbinensis TaxID=58114 RepID=A0A1G7AMU8_9ACTN|nr:hypothetical protein [Glycomyces harbinensis]SDE16112.1 hypothetical protein SAMN05216270_11443 [Glycomyces harbinensis]
MTSRGADWAPGPAWDAERLARAGLVLLGEAGTVEEVRSAWKVFVSADAEPSVRISDALGEAAEAVLEHAWVAVARRNGVVSDVGEFLLSVEGEGAWGRPWFHVRTDGSPRIGDLGPYPGQPGFIASSLDRSAMVAVSTEEHESWILVGGGQTER